MRKLASIRNAVYIVVLVVLILSLVPLGGTPAVANPGIIYVDASNVGDPDENGSVAHPFDSIQEGINVAALGDTVQIAAGTYNETITLKSGVVVQGAGAEVTIIDGGGAGEIVSAISVDSCVVDGFTITTGSYCAILIEDNSSATITNNIITNIRTLYDGYGIYVTGNSSANISNNIITNNYSSEQNEFGIELYDACSATISNNIITNISASNYGTGISVWYSSATIINNTIANNSDRGIICGSSSTTIINCIIWGNGDDLYNCSATYSDIEDMEAGTGNIHADPMFVAGNNYHLKPGSPCIDVGSNAAVPGWLTTDFEGDDRVVDGDYDGVALVDIGADEHVPTVEEKIWQKVKEIKEEVEKIGEKMFLPQPTIVMLQGNITDDADNPVAVGSIYITIKDSGGTEVWNNTFADVIDIGRFDIPLGSAKELSLVPDSVYQLVIAIDVGSATFVAADVTFGDGSSAGDVIKFTP